MFEFWVSRAKAAKLAKEIYPWFYGIIRLLRGLCFFVFRLTVARIYGGRILRAYLFRGPSNALRLVGQRLKASVYLFLGGVALFRR
jgi:hypothetical protein